MARRFIGHPVRGQTAKLFINQRQQFLGGFGIALLSRLKDASDVAHGLQSSSETTGDNSKQFTGRRDRFHELLRREVLNNQCTWWGEANDGPHLRQHLGHRCDVLPTAIARG